MRKQIRVQFIRFPVMMVMILLLCSAASSLWAAQLVPDQTAGDSCQESAAVALAAYTNISAAQAREILYSAADVLFLDVREVAEYNAGHIPGALNMPWNSGYLPAHHTELPSKPIVVYCAAGGRSAAASQFLVNNGHTDISNMLGGFTAWVALTPIPMREFDFEGDSQGWAYRELWPGPSHLSHWELATSITTAQAIGIATPFDESTNYFGLWDSLNALPIAYLPEQLYEVTWNFSTTRETTNAVPSLRCRVGSSNQKSFSYIRLYPGDWLPLAQQPQTTSYRLYYEPLTTPTLFLAYSLIDWTDDFRGTSPAGAVSLEEVEVWHYDKSDFEPWTAVGSWSATDFDLWTTAGAPPYQYPLYTSSVEGLSLSSGIGASDVFGSWDSPAGLMSLEPNKLYRLTARFSGSEPLGGPELRVRVHTDDHRFAWYTYYVGSWSAAESALPPVAGKDYYLYLRLPTSETRSGSVSFDLIDFSETMGGQLNLLSLALHSD